MLSMYDEEDNRIYEQTNDGYQIQNMECIQRNFMENKITKNMKGKTRLIDLPEEASQCTFNDNVNQII